jgi:NAD(P)-dependent dehydrogenase (short-subunit alcohol dehydrogenase family)
MAQAQAELGGVDILINNAGITRDSMLAKLSEEKWDEVIRVNLKGPFNMGQTCAKLMMEKKYGRIVNLASVAWLGNIGQTNYSASKAGVVGLTRTWALELARYGVTCNAIAPGLIESALTQGIPAEVKDKFIQRIPLKRIGDPQDIAELVCFLASDAASYVTGQCIQIDGGLSTGISVV